MVKQTDFAQVKIAAQLNWKKFIPKFFCWQIQNPDVLEHLKTCCA
jgi:hypothetical protein